MINYPGIDVIRPKMAETTSLGAALAAAKAIGLWSERDDRKGQQTETEIFSAKMQTEVRDGKFKRWNEAIQRSLGWEQQKTLL